MVSAAGKKERRRPVISQVAKVAAFILAQFAQQLAQLESVKFRGQTQSRGLEKLKNQGTHSVKRRSELVI